MKIYKIIFIDNRNSLEITADMYSIEDGIIKFKVLESLEPVAVFNINNIVGFKFVKYV
jgi:hypothetical protein